MLVEGAVMEKMIMSHLLDIYGISKSHEIVSYKTSIYDLYDRMFADSDPEMLDLLQVLREREKDEEMYKPGVPKDQPPLRGLIQIPRHTEINEITANAILILFPS